MKTLAFKGRAHVREARFEDRSLVPRNAVCLTGAAIRERLTALLEAPVVLRVSEPAIPDAAAWSEIARGALLWRVRGSVADAAIVLRENDALALAAAAFGELPPHAAGRRLSPIERDVLERIVAALSETLVPLVGVRERAAPSTPGSLPGYETYLEALIEMPVEARIGIALSRDPAPEPAGGLALDDIAQVGLAPVASLDLGCVEASGVAALVPGAILPITGSSAFRGSLRLAGRTLARGTCGVVNGRYALAVEGT